MAGALPFGVVSRLTVGAGFEGIFVGALSAEMPSEGGSSWAPLCRSAPARSDPGWGRCWDRPSGPQGDTDPSSWSLGRIHPLPNPSAGSFHLIPPNCTFLQLSAAPWLGFEKSLKRCGRGAEPQRRGGDSPARAECSTQGPEKRPQRGALGGSVLGPAAQGNSQRGARSCPGRCCCQAARALSGDDYLHLALLISSPKIYPVGPSIVVAAQPWVLLEPF